MTDIPEMYLAEAVRRLNAEADTVPYNDQDYYLPSIKAFARTLQELGWTPPIDEARMAKARATYKASQDALLTRGDPVRAIYDALGED